MARFKGVWALLFISGCIIGMEKKEVIIGIEEAIVIERTVVTDFLTAQWVASMQKEDRAIYTLAPELISYIIKKDMIAQKIGAKKSIVNAIEISPQEENMVRNVQKQGEKKYKRLENAVYALLANQKRTTLQEVRGKLYYYELCMLSLSNEKLQKQREKLRLYESYKPHVIPSCWAFSLIAELVVLGAIVCVALNAC